MWSVPAALAVILAMDAAWFSVSVPRIYSPAFSRVIGKSWAFKASPPNILSAVAVYVLMGFMARHAAVRSTTAARAASTGAVAMAAAFAVYNLTNMSVFGVSEWGLATALVDTAWGAAVGAASAAAAFAVMR
nr:DUF2177 domain-containing protein [Oceanusvirus sp.]